MRTRRLFNITLGAVIAFFGVTIGSILTNGSDVFSSLESKATNPYSLVLDNSNAVSSSGDHVITTLNGGKVTFTYNNVSSSSGNHVFISEGGYVTNKDIIHSISSFTASFTGSLKARLAYTTTTWGDYFSLVSGQTVNTGSKPYYIELKAESAVTLQSLDIIYSCEINPSAESTEIEGSYDITFVTHASDDDTDISGNSDNIINELATGSDFVNSASGSKLFKGKNGLKSGSKNSSGSLTLNFKSTLVYETITSIYIDIATFGNDGGTFSIEVNDNPVGNSVQVSAGSGTFNFNGVVSSLRISTTKRAYFEGISLIYDSATTPGEPTPDEVGFTAKDNNKDEYKTNSVFDNDNGLSVYRAFSDNSQESLSLGENGYSYQVFDSLNNAIDTSKPFENEGYYSIVVSYKEYIPIEINILVGEYVYALELTPSMEVSTFNTSDILSEHLVNNLTALLSYSNGSSQLVNYSDFSLFGITIELLTPKGFSRDITIPFGLNGNWTLNVYLANDPDTNGSVNLTVNAIPVTSITLNETECNLYVDDQIQLTTVVNPNNATNNNVTWTTNDESVATVNEDGLVTAVGIGIAKIYATAADGSGVMATCTLTVTAKPIVLDPYIIEFKKNSADSSTAINNLTELSDQITNGDDYISSIGTIDKIFAGINGLKMGSGSSTGTLVINFDSSKLSDTITSIHIDSARFSSDTGNLNVTINNEENTHSLNPSEGGDISVNDKITKMTISTSTKRAYLSKITFNRKSSTPVTPVYPTSIELSGNNSISVGGTSELSVTYYPSTTNMMNTSFTSSNENVATVSEEGIITGVGVGNATITATTDAGNDETINETFDITVNSVPVSSVSLSSNSESVKVGKTVTLVATILPSNATNKALNWSSSNASVATVSNGVITGVTAGETTITVRTVDGNKEATCIVTVSANVESTWELVTDASTLSSGDVLLFASNTNEAVNGNIDSQTLTKQQATFSSDKTEITSLSDDALPLVLGGSENSWTFSNENDQLLGSTAAKKLAWDANNTTWSISISGGNASIVNNNTNIGKILYNTGSPRFNAYTSASSSSMPLPQIYRCGVQEDIDPTGILLSNNEIELNANGSTDLTVSYIPKNANRNKEITWSSSNTNVATVNNGKVTVTNNANEGDYAIITAKLTNFPTISATCRVDVVSSPVADQTIMIYMCGADLESENGLASGDIYEILKVNGQPSDVNIIIETGGASSWDSSYGYGISSTKLERWHVSNKSLIKEASLNYASMGLTSTFQSFLEWGLNNYPANRTGVILWNHGGGMRGVCYDEKKSDDSLLNSEVNAALKNAFTNVGRSKTNKLEWIGYDACLMAVQDIAEFNSEYFNYMIASEESEAGYGWDYDNWVDNLYKKASTTTLLKEICDTFISDNGGSNSSGDQTLSYLDLSYMSEYKTAWDNMAKQLLNKLTSSNRSSFNNAIISKVKHYADSDYDYFCTFDAKDFVNKLANNSSFSSFRIDSSYTNAVLTAFSHVVVYSNAQKGAGESYGLCMYWPNSAQYSDIKTYYTTSQTNFADWRTVCVNYGYHS